MRDRIARSVRWIVWSRGVVQVISFASTLVVARLLAPADYGLVALSGIWTVTLSRISELGLGSAIIQFHDPDDRELNSCFWLTLAVAALGYFALYVCAPPIGAWFENSMLPAVIRVAGLTLPLVAVRTVPDALLRKRLELDKVSKAEIASTAVAIPVMLGTARAGGGVWTLVIGALTIGLVQGMMTFWFARWWPGLRVGGVRLPSMFRYGMACVGISLCWATVQQADTFILGKTSGGVVLGLYSMAKQLAMLPLEKIGPMVNQIAFPVMAELQGDRRAMAATLMRGLRLMAWATLPMCLGLAVIARDLVHTILSDKWAAAVPIIHVLCAYAATRALTALFPVALVAQYRARFVFTYSAVLLGVMPVAFWIGARWAGAVGVATAWAVIHPIVMLWLAREVLRAIDVSWKTLSIELGRPLAATLLMVATVLAMNWALSSWEGLGRLAMSSLVGAAAYAAGLWQFGGSVHGEIREMTGWVFRKSPSRIACPVAR